MQNLLRNLRFSLRMLVKNPGLTLTILLTLALGVGANTAIFTVDYATLLQPLPYPQPDQLVVVWSKIQGFHNGMSAGDFTDWKRENTTFQDMNAWTGGAFNLSTKDQPEQIDGRMVTPGFYRMLGTPFFLGRDFLPEEGQTGRDHEVILTHKLWKRLGANSNIVGQTLKVNAEPYTVVGVLAPGLYDRGQGDIVVPLAFKPEQLNHDFHWLLTIGRLKPGVTLEQARADMDAVTAHIAQQYPKSNKGWGAFVEPLKNDFMPKERIRTLWMLMGAVAFVLLIACVNVANLLMARSMARQKEMAVRSSLGATPKAIFAQLLTESILLALIGGVLGIGVGYAMLHAFMAAMPEGTLPSEADLSLNFPVLLFTLGATTLAYREIFGARSRAEIPGLAKIKPPLLGDIPVIGPAVFEQVWLLYLGIALIVATALVLRFTSIGLAIHAAGAEPKAVDKSGLSVTRIRYGCVLFAGFMASLSGAFLSIGDIHTFTEGMTRGAGYLAIASVIFGKWRIGGTVIACLLFGAATALQFQLPALGIAVPNALLIMLPYLLALLAVGGLVGRQMAPATLGEPYRR